MRPEAVSIRCTKAFHHPSSIRNIYIISTFADTLPETKIAPAKKLSQMEMFSFMEGKSFSMNTGLCLFESSTSANVPNLAMRTLVVMVLLRGMKVANVRVSSKSKTTILTGGCFLDLLRSENRWNNRQTCWRQWNKSQCYFTGETRRDTRWLYASYTWLFVCLLK